MDIVGSRTLRDLWDDLARDAGERTFLVFEDASGAVVEHTYAQFEVLVARTANLFTSLGVGRGDAVAVHLRNCPELLMCMFGLAEIGAVLVPLHPRSTREECADIAARVEARVVVCEPDGLAVWGVPAAPVVPAAVPGAVPDGAPSGAVADGPRVVVQHVLVARSATPHGPVHGVTRFEEARDAQPDRLAVDAALSSDDPAGIVFTSGTTARPKGVVLTHANLIFSGHFVDWQASLTSADRLLTTMPACHVNFQLNALMPVLTAGATLVMVERYSASQFWRQVCRHDATVVQSIAMMVRTMLLQPAAPWERENRVREVLYYLPITDEEKARFEERFATRILNSYGTSETLVGVLTDPPHGERRWPSIGRVGLGYEARVADEQGREVGPGVVGEIQVRGVLGRTLMQGYHKDPAATAAAVDADGWLHTGDLGWVDDDGWFYFVERRTLLIKRSGESVSPAEVEAALSRHPGVCECAVIGVPDPIHDEAVKAFVVPAPGVVLTERDVQEHCRALLAEFKVPTVVEIVPSLPHTRSFKVAKASLG
ncbi:AMP-binding protein [Actinotalea subterranea]|uniref:AMP-binding protein n=1 Tax=Actinotalea subterranea TaxID=2607497 RepID=UPI001CAA85AC|nr:AMP-binding protein [Actinotalea subterranea]